MDQRYCSNILGRFTSPDPSKASTGQTDTGSWIRYTYTRGDPTNRCDPRVLSDCNPNEDENVCWDEDDDHGGGGGSLISSVVPLSKGGTFKVFMVDDDTTTYARDLLADRLKNIGNENCAPAPRISTKPT